MPLLPFILQDRTSTLPSGGTRTCIRGEGENVPLLRWAGSKKKILPLLEQAAPPQMRRYVEPFVGSGVLFLRLRSPRALLSDINADLIQTYRTVRAHSQAVWRMANRWPTSSQHYYELRAADPKALSDVERAARFIYLNRFCFNGVYRTNRQGQFNVARGKGHLGIPPVEIFEEFARRLRRVELRCGDFASALDEVGEGQFCYLDPPYASSGLRDRGEYGAGSFKDADLDRLATGLQAADARGAKLLLSYSAHEKLLQKLPGWRVRRLSVVRNVSGFTSARRKAKEVLISNYTW